MVIQVRMKYSIIACLSILLSAVIIIWYFTTSRQQRFLQVQTAVDNILNEGFAGSLPEEQVGINAQPDFKLEIGRNSQLPVKRGDGGYGGINGEATSILSFNRDVSNIPPNYGPNYPPTLATDYATDPQVGDPTNTVQGAILKNFKGSFTNKFPYEYKPFQKKYPDDCYSEYWF